SRHTFVNQLTQILIERRYICCGRGSYRPSVNPPRGTRRSAPAEIDREIAMAKVIEARAFCNNEVAYLAWKTDGKIKDCLGFMITRIDLNTGERRLLPAWVAFDTQSNPDWEEQDTSVWPIQKFSWRDLTLRRSRNTLQIRAPFRAKYEIVPVGLAGPGRVAVPPSPT